MIGGADGAEKVYSRPSAEEHAYWLRRAALLDPDANEFFQGTFDETVPDGETWYAHNLWWCDISGDPVHVRRPPGAAALALPAGTRLRNHAGGAGGSFFHVCNPALVAADEKYKDPRALYYQRMARLENLAVRTSTIPIAAGTALGAGNVVYKAYPSIAERLMLVFVDAFDVAWVVLASGASTGKSNTWHEISDDQRMRAAEACMYPILRAEMPGFSVRPANISGSGTSVAGHGTVGWIELPEDW